MCSVSPSGFRKLFQLNPDKYTEHSRFTVRQCERQVDSGCVCKCVWTLEASLAGGAAITYKVRYIKLLYAVI